MCRKFDCPLLVGQWQIPMTFQFNDITCLIVSCFLFGEAKSYWHEDYNNFVGIDSEAFAGTGYYLKKLILLQIMQVLLKLITLTEISRGF